MYDRNGIKIKHGRFVRYDGQIYLVKRALWKRLVLIDNDENELKLQIPTRKFNIVNIEVVNGLRQTY